MSFQELLQETWARNTLTILAELLIVVGLFALLTALTSKLLRSLAAAPALAGLRPAAEVVRQNLKGALLFAGFLACVGLAGFGGWLWYGGEDLYAYTLAELRSIPPSFWIELGIASAKVIGLAIAVAIALRFVRKILAFLERRAWEFEGIRANDESIESFFGFLGKSLRGAAWIGWLVLSAQLLGAPTPVQTALTTALVIFLTIALGLLCWRGVDAVIVSLDALSKKYASKKNLLRYYDQLQKLIPVLRSAVQYVICIGVSTLVLLQIETVASLAEWGPRFVRIIGILFLSRVIIELTGLLLEEILITRSKLDADGRKRRRTIVPLLRSILTYVVYFAAGIMILEELQIDPTPILAGAGIMALAVGLGAQNLINDVVSGFFILFENHFLVGDFVEINDAEGIVEAIELRTTRVRDTSGRQHVFRNGQIDTLRNYSKDFTSAVVEVGVAYESDLSHVLATLEQVGREVREALPDVQAPMEVQGLESFGESELTMRTVTRVRPGKHREVQREIRRRIKLAFDENGIEIPYARRVVIMQTEDPASAPLDEQAGPSAARAG